MLTAATVALAVWAIVQLRGALPSRATLTARATQRLRPDGVAASLPEAIDAVAAAVRSGRSVHDGLAVAADAAPPRLAAELRAVVTDTERGVPLTDALDRWSGTSTVPGAPLVASAVGLTGETGGDVAAALGGVADTLRERRALAREIRALSSQARLSAAVIAVAPLGFAVLASATDGDTARFLFGSVGGAICLAIGVGLDLVGWRWMGRIAASVGDR
jgi:tight adherence protein B